MWPNRSFLRIWSHLLKKSLMENFIFFMQCLFSEGYLDPIAFLQK